MLDPASLAGIVDAVQAVCLCSLVFCPAGFIDECRILLEAVPHPVGAVRAAPAGEVADIGVRRRLMMVGSKSCRAVHTAVRAVIVAIRRPTGDRRAFVGEGAFSKAQQSGKSARHDTAGGVALHVPDTWDGFCAGTVVFRTNAE